MKKINKNNWAVLQTIVFLRAAMRVQHKDYNNLVGFVWTIVVPWVNAESIMILVGDMKLTHHKDT